MSYTGRQPGTIISEESTLFETFNDTIEYFNSSFYTKLETDSALGNVDNTSDANKPVSIATQTALNLKEDANIINTDNVPNIFVGGKRKEWTKGLAAFTGMIAIEITGLYNQSNMNGMMNVHILEVSTTKQARIITVSGQWNNSSSQWDYGFAVDYNSLVAMNIRFARDTVNEKVYVLIGDVSSSWNNTRVSIEIPLSSYNTNLNLGFNIGSLNTLTGLNVDFTKAITLKADQSTTYTKTEVDNIIGSFEALPDQTGNGGKYLTTDGTDASWAELETDFPMSNDTIPVGTSFTIPSGKQLIVDHLDVEGTLDIQGTLATVTGGYLSQTTMKTEVIENPVQGNGLTINEPTYLIGGNVGIGTSSPVEKLDVNGKIAVGGNKILSNISTDNYIWAGSNSLKVVDSSGNNVRMNIDSNGYVTTPYQPAAVAYNSSSIYFVNQIITYSNTRINVGNNMNASTGYFTAPVSGTYQISMAARTPSDNVSGTKNVYVIVNGATVGGNLFWETSYVGANHFGLTNLFYLNAGDTVALMAGGIHITMDTNDYFAVNLIG